MAPSVSDLTSYGLTAVNAAQGPYSFDADATIGTVSQVALNKLKSSVTFPADIASEVSGVVGTLSALAIAGGAGAAETAGVSVAAVAFLAASYAAIMGLASAFGDLAGAGAGCCFDADGTPKDGKGNCPTTNADGSPYWGWATQMGGSYAAPAAGSAEEFIYNVILADFNASINCKNLLAAQGRAAALLPVAVAAWNATHQGTSVRTIARTVNVAQQNDTFGTFYTPGSFDPIGIAAQAIAQAANLPPNATFQVTVHDGALIPYTEPASSVLPKFTPPAYAGPSLSDVNAALALYTGPSQADISDALAPYLSPAASALTAPSAPSSSLSKYVRPVAIGSGILGAFWLASRWL